MDFRLSPTQRVFQERCHDFAVRCLRPFAMEADQVADVPGAWLRQPEIRTVMRAFIPVEYGGGWSMQGSTQDLAGSALLRVIFNEEAAYGDASLFIAMPGPSLSVPILSAFGTEEQKRRLFSLFLDPEQVRWAAFAMTEPTAGSDVAGIKTTARKENGHYVLNGTKWFIGNGLRADWIIVFATTNPKLGRFGIKTFLVERGTPGFEAVRVLPTLGLRAVQVSELQFRECRIPEENLLRPSGTGTKGGFDGGMATMQQFRPTVAAMAVGTARAALDEATEFAQQNGAFHAEARRWREHRRRLEYLRVRVHAARLLCWQAAAQQDAGQDSFSYICMAKAFAAKVALEACSAAAEVVGIAAASSALPFERLYRDAKAFDILEGTGDMQRLMLTKAMLRAAPAYASRESC